LRHFLLFLTAVALFAGLILRIRYGGGDPYDDVSTPPILQEGSLEEFLGYPEPIGNVALSPDGRLFFTVHPESRPRGNRLLEYVDGASVPFPSGAAQPQLFDTVLGLVVDDYNRLWTIDNGNHGFGSARLLAFDLASGEVVHDHRFARDAAPAGSFLQDLRVSDDGRTVFIADASIWRKSPAIVVYDTETRSARRLLEAQPSVSADNYLIRNPIRDMRFAGGIISLKAGVDGITLDESGEWLYYGAMNHSGLFRVRVDALTDPSLPARELESDVERFSNKPLSDGLAADANGNIYVTDVEHGAVFIVGPDRRPRTLIRSPKIRWADSLSFGPDGWLYLADSAIPELVLTSKEHIQSQGPYHIFRFRPETPVSGGNP